MYGRTHLLLYIRTAVHVGGWVGEWEGGWFGGWVGGWVMSGLLLGGLRVKGGLMVGGYTVFFRVRWSYDYSKQFIVHVTLIYERTGYGGFDDGYLAYE